jgi:outer membrane murein-binding lipoprotein Lpp
MSRKAQWFVAAVAVLGLGLSGCARFNIRGDSFKEDDMSTTVRQTRPQETQGVPWGVSNKALQIEKDFGIQ